MKLGVIPARGGSKRIPKKNIKEFCGRPMIAYALDAANECGLFDRIHVSTDSIEIAEVVAKLGYPIDFIRKPDLADDFCGLVPVLKWIVDQYRDRGENYDQVCCIVPNAPLIKSSDLIRASEIFDQNNGSLPLLVYTRYPVPVEWAFRRSPDGLMYADDPSKLLKRSQDLVDAYYECGPFSIWKSEHLNNESPIANGSLSYLMPAERAIDIDTPEDLSYAERMYRLLNES